MQTGIGRGPGTQERVTRGPESTPLCRLVEGPRGTFLKGEDNGDIRLDWDSAEVGNGTNKLWATQAVGESRTHSGTSQTSNKHSPNQGSNSRTVKSCGEAA